MQLGERVTTTDNLLGAIKEMTDKVVRAVQDVVRPPRYPSNYLPSYPYQNARPQPEMGSPYLQQFHHSADAPPRFSHPGRRVLCYACGYPGHFARNCSYSNMTNDRYRPRSRGFVPEAPTPHQEAPQYTQQQPEGRPNLSQQSHPELNGQPTVASHTAEVGVEGSTARVDQAFLSKTVGECYSVSIMFGDVMVPCLLDPGSQVTTVGERYFYDHLREQSSSPSSSPSARGGVQGILGMNVLQQCWEQLMSASHKPHLKIPWPISRDPIWQRTLHTVGKTLEFGADDGIIGKAYLGGQSIVLSARQGVVVKAKGRAAPDGGIYEAFLEPSSDGGSPASITVPPCFVQVESGSFHLALFNETNSEVVIPKSATLGTLRLGSVVQQTNDSKLADKETPTVSMAKVSVGGPSLSSVYPVPVDVGTHITQVQGRKVAALLGRYKDTFSQHDRDIGFTDAITHQIDTGTAHPIRQRHRPLPPSQYKTVRDHIQGLLKEGIVRESASPWASPVVVVQKKDSSIRLCVDYRQLNQLTHRHSFPLPRIEESLQALGGAKFFSVLDLTSGYYQVAVDPVDVEKTAFTVPFGLFEYTRLPFGLSNAPATFQRLMQRCLGGQCFDSVLIYLDDIIVFSPDFNTHLSDLGKVFASLHEHGLKLKPSKCHLLQPEVQYLGHRVSSDGVAVDPDKIAVVQKWPEPSSVRDVRAFLGFTGFFRRFIQNYASLANPLFRYLSGGKKKMKGRKPINGRTSLTEEGSGHFCSQRYNT